MTIENLARLINGQTLNKPSVSSITDFAFEAKNVRQGYAFFALDAGENDVDLAVKQDRKSVV